MCSSSDHTPNLSTLALEGHAAPVATTPAGLSRYLSWSVRVNEYASSLFVVNFNLSHLAPVDG